MKIALILPSFPVANEVSLPADQHLADLLADRLELHVYALFHPPGRASFRSGKAIVHPSGGGQYRQIFTRMLNDVRAEHRRSPFDVIHANRLYPGGLLAIVTGRWLRVPSMASIGGVELINFSDIGYGGSQTRIARVLNGFVLGNADVVTVPSRYILRQAQQARPDRHYDVAPLPIKMTKMKIDSVDQVALRDGFDPVQPRILSVGSLYPLKDQETLIRAFSIVRDEIPGAALTIAGGDPFGYRQVLEDINIDLNLQGAVEFAGDVPHGQMSEYYQNADLFMYASRHESQGLVILEAATQGLPIVSTNVGILPELAPDAAVAVPVRNPVALGTATLNLLRNPRRMQQLGINAAQYVQDSFQDNMVVERFVDIYRVAVR